MANENTSALETRITVSPDSFRENITEQLRQDFRLLADMLTVKVNDIRPWYDTKKGVVADTTEDILRSQKVRPRQLVVLTHVSAMNSAHAGTTLQIAIERGGEVLVLNRVAPAAVNTTVNWDGQAIMAENDCVKVSHFGATAADILSFSASGYEIKA